MGDKKAGWSLDVPTDPNKVASYSSNYVNTLSQGENMSKEIFEKTLKQVSRKIKPSKRAASKPKT